MADSKHFQQASQDFASDLAALRDDIAKLTGSVSHLLRGRINSTSDRASGAYSQTRDNLSGRAGDLSDRANDLRDTFASRTNDLRDHLSNRAAEAQDRFGAFSSDVETKIERNPLTAVVVAAVAGLLMGLLSRSF